mmetsp:Transcript_10416/g.22647  ORF Transcript_10416/g.22647 Transcript_10416/m.22647 type:complete len:360 (-) Transcript_10416:62-1141(-)
MMSNHIQSANSPEARKKNSALPSLLSNLRNAQAVIGRAADDLHEREVRPLVGGGGGSRMSASINNPQLNRGPSSTFSSHVQNFSERFGSQWRKRSTARRKKGTGVTIVPQSFFIAVGCFFFAFPVIFVIVVLARHAVFGDEGDGSITQTHIHEVPSAFSNGRSFESGKELLEKNKMDPPPAGEIEVAAEGTSGKKSSSSEGLEVYDKMMKENDPPVLIESTKSDLHSDVKQNLLGETNNQTIGEIPDKSESMRNSIEKIIIDGSTKEGITTNMQDVISERGGNTFTKEEIRPSTSLKELGDQGVSEEAAKASTSDLSATSIRKESVKSTPSSDQVKEESGVEKEATNHKNLRGSLNGDK